MSMELGWRRFNFFDKSDVPDPTDETQPFGAFKGLNLKFWTSGDGFAVLGDPQGMVFKVAKDLQLQVWKAHGHSLEGFTQCGGYLATVGEDEPNDGFWFKLWNLNSWEMNEPHCEVSAKVTMGKSKLTGRPVSVALSDSLDMACVGMDDTSVLFYYGDLLNDRHLKWRSLDSTQNTGDLTGVAVASQAAIHVVFVITKTQLTSYLMESGVIIKKILHDCKGCQPNCWFFSSQDNSLALASKDIVYFYDINNCLESGNEKGRCFALARGVNKVQLARLGHYILLLTQKPAIIPNSESATMFMLNIYDVEFGYVAFHCPMPSNCQVFVLDDVVHIIAGDGKLSQVQEKPLAEKLESLKKKNLFDVAIGLAKRHNYRDLPKIYLNYGDYLYAKGDFDNAVKQYVETMGEVEPSYVIKKFVDGSRIPQLCTYLEQLHVRNLNEDPHSILLLSAYIKLNAKEKIVKFVEKTAEFKKFDVETAIHVLRTANFNKVALKLAQKHRLHDTYLDILIVELKEFETAIQFMETQTLEQKAHFLSKFGPVLFKHNRTIVTDMVKQIVLEKPDLSKELVRAVLEDPECLEQVFRKPSGDGFIAPKDTATSTALLEHLVTKMTPEEKKDQDKLDQLYELVRPENVNDAIQIGRQHQVPALVVHVYRKTKKTEDLLRYLLQEGDLEHVIEMCDERILKDMWIELITHVSRKTDMNTSDLMKLLDKVQVFQISKCSVCDTALQVPAVHFVCTHSFHRHCFESFADGQEQCPVCSAAIEQQTPPPKPNVPISHITFQQELQNCSDAISLIADYIARGAFDAGSL